MIGDTIPVATDQHEAGERASPTLRSRGEGQWALRDVNVREKVTTLQVVNAIHNRQVWAAALPVLTQLNRRDIPVIVLKSLPQVEELYGDAGGRATWDVDLVVPGHRAADALDALFQLGWRLHKSSEYGALKRLIGSEQAASRLPWHVLDPTQPYEANIDLHSDRMDPWRDPPLDPAIWARTVRVQQDGIEYRRLGPEDRLVYLCWHFVADGFPWQKLVDIQYVLLHDHTIEWDVVQERARNTGMRTIVYLVCELAAARASAPIEPRWRAVLTTPLPWRRLLLLWILHRVKNELRQRETIVLRAIAHDSLAMLVASAREVLLPDRVYLAAFGYGVRDTWRDYLSALIALHASRLRPWR